MLARPALQTISKFHVENKLQELSVETRAGCGFYDSGIFLISSKYILLESKTV